MRLGLGFKPRGGDPVAWLAGVTPPSGTAPAIAWDFQNGRYALSGASSSLTALTTTTRASTATYYDASGVLHTAAADTARIGAVMAGGPVGLISEQTRWNYTRNGTWAGAVAGAPGTAPTGQTWQTGVSGSLGLTREIVSVRTENGITWLRIKYSGVTSGATLGTLAFLYSSTDTAAVNGQTWSANLRVALVDGSFTGLTTFVHRLRFNDVGANALTNVDASLLSATSTPANYEVNLTASNASTAYVGQALVIGAPLSTTINFTIDLGVPQLEQGLYSTSFIPTSGSAVARSTDSVKWTAAAMALFSASAGTFLLRGRWRNYAVSANGFGASDGTSSNRILLNQSSGGLTQLLTSSTGGAAAAGSAIGPTLTTDAAFTAAAAIATNNMAVSYNGGAVVTDSTVDFPVGIDRVYIGSGPTGTDAAFSVITGFYYWPSRLTNSDLPVLSA